LTKTLKTKSGDPVQNI